MLPTLVGLEVCELPIRGRRGALDATPGKSHGSVATSGRSRQDERVAERVCLEEWASYCFVFGFLFAGVINIFAFLKILSRCLSVFSRVQ